VAGAAVTVKTQLTNRKVRPGVPSSRPFARLPVALFVRRCVAVCVAVWVAVCRSVMMCRHGPSLVCSWRRVCAGVLQCVLHCGLQCVAV